MRIGGETLLFSFVMLRTEFALRYLSAAEDTFRHLLREKVTPDFTLIFHEDGEIISEAPGYERAHPSYGTIQNLFSTIGTKTLPIHISKEVMDRIPIFYTIGFENHASENPTLSTRQHVYHIGMLRLKNGFICFQELDMGMRYGITYYMTEAGVVENIRKTSSWKE